MKLSSLFKNEWTIAVLACLLFIPYLGHIHLFDWDEINFAENAREMITSGDYFSVQMNYERFTEKPPLFFWLQVISMRIWGINEMGARFPNAMAGLATLLVLFRIGKSLLNTTFARVWVMVYLGTFFTFLYSKSGIIDPWFNLFIFGAVYQFYTLHTQESGRLARSLLTGFLLGLAILTKGPVALLICLLTFFVMLIRERGKRMISLQSFLLVTVSCFITCFAWFGVDLIKHGPQFMIEFIQRQIAIFSTSDADHGEPFFYHWWVLLLGCFPASIFFIRGLFCNPENQQTLLFKKWMSSLFWVTLLLFSMVTTKIIHYSSLCWLPLTFMAALFIYMHIYAQSAHLSKIMVSAIVLLGFVMGSVFAAIPVVMMQKEKWVHLLDDPFARANLQAGVPWHYWQSLGGIILIVGVVFFLISNNRKLSIPILLGSVTITTYFLILFIFPSVEAISQRANLEFFTAHAGEDCYVETLGYKSYAPYFYGKVVPPDDKQKKILNAVRAGNSTQSDTLSSFEKETAYKNWLLTGEINKPVYFSVKIMDRLAYDTLPYLTHLYEKNGFVFYKRVPGKTK